MKKILVLLFCLLTLQSQAGIRAILVEPDGAVYHLTIYGRLEAGAPEKLDIKDVAELSKLTGIEGQSEFNLGGVKPLRYWIWFADASNPDKVEGTVSQIDIHTTESKEFVQKVITPEATASKDAIVELKTLVESKPVADGK